MLEFDVPLGQRLQPSAANDIREGRANRSRLPVRAEDLAGLGEQSLFPVAYSSRSDYTRASDDRGWLTDTYVDTAVLNGVYALLRHLPWHETPIFQELLAEYLRCELNIPSETASRIYELGKTLS